MAQSVSLPPKFADVADASDLDDGGDRRAYRAHTEDMLALPKVDTGDCTGVYQVHSQSGKTYVVDVESGACNCPDAVHNSPENGCKHARRVAIEISDGVLPAPGEDVEPFFESLTDRMAEIDARARELFERAVRHQEFLRTIEDRLDRRSE